MQLIDSLDVGEDLVYRRATTIGISDGQVVAEMEDDFHHFRITLKHDTAVVLGLQGESIRFPWTTCGAESAQQMGQLVGVSLGPLRDQLTSAQRFQYCTHYFDLVQLAINYAGSAPSTHLYQVAVALRPKSGPLSAVLKLNAETLFDWEFAEGAVTQPASHRGITIDELTAWARLPAQAEVSEAALYFQRALYVSVGKIIDWSSAKVAADMGMPAVCYTFQPAIAPRSARLSASGRDYRDCPEGMLGGKNIAPPRSD